MEDYTKTLTIELVPGKKYVVLLVNTTDLSPGDDPKGYCSFPDLYNGSIADYETAVLPGDAVVWLGVSSSAPADDKVEITMINHRGGKNLLGPPQGGNGKVERIVDENAQIDDTETYAIHFVVIKQGGPANTYILDPILRVH